MGNTSIRGDSSYEVQCAAAAAEVAWLKVALERAQISMKKELARKQSTQCEAELAWQKAQAETHKTTIKERSAQLRESDERLRQRDAELQRERSRRLAAESALIELRAQLAEQTTCSW